MLETGELKSVAVGICPLHSDLFTFAGFANVLPFSLKPKNRALLET